MSRIPSWRAGRMVTAIVVLALIACTVTALAGFGDRSSGPALALVLAIVVAIGGVLLRRRPG